MRWLVAVVSRMPWRWRYRLADVLAWLMAVWGYRRAVLRANLAQAFPEKTPAERAAIRRAFYRHLADVVLEVMGAFRMSAAALRRRVRVVPSSGYAALCRQGGIIVTGHLGNWEWAGLRVGLDLDFPHYVVYLPLSNRRADGLMRSLRERLGNVAVPVKRITRRLLRMRGRRFAASFLADQNPPPPDIQAWYRFFGRPVPVHMGAERLARRLGVPVYWAYAYRVGRGRYEITVEVLSAHPAGEAPGAVMKRYMERLEAAIRRHPEQWLWSHRRWKLTPPAERADTTAGAPAGI